MAIDKLYFSKVDYNWRGHKSNFLNSKNLDAVLKSDTKLDYHTSIQDVKVQNVQRVCCAAEEIHVIDITLKDISNMDFDENPNHFAAGRFFKELIVNFGKVKNFDSINNFNLRRFNTHHATRQSSDRTLWTVGCSITHGDGVEHSQRWGTHLAQYLNMPEVSLSKSGSSQGWAADQILRSNINAGDVVVWGLTNTHRFDYAINWELQTAIVGKPPRELHYLRPEYFDSTTHTALCIRQILQVINFCKKLNVELYIANFLDLQLISVALRDYDNFIDLTNGLEVSEFINFKDRGSDRRHPGPIQHKHYADQIFDLIEKRRGAL